MAEVDTRHRQAQQRLAQALAARLGLLLSELPLEGQEGLEVYAAQAVPLVAGGQRSAATLAIAYVARLSPPTLGKLPPSVSRALEGRSVTPESPVASAPVLRVWGRLNEGDSPEVARAAGASYAEALSSGDLQAAQRGGLDEGARAGERKLSGWSKLLGPEACSWCEQVAGRVYRSAEKVPFHERDHCSVSPVFK